MNRAENDAKFFLRLPTTLLKAMEKAAAADDRGIADWTRRALAKALEQRRAK